MFFMSWFVYIAESKFGHYYTGITTDAPQRIVKHNAGKGSQMGKQQGPFVLVYKSQLFSTKSEAREREVQVKGWNRNKKKKLINGEWK